MQTQERVQPIVFIHHRLITALCCRNLFRSHHNGEGKRRHRSADLSRLHAQEGGSCGKAAASSQLVVKTNDDVVKAKSAQRKRKSTVYSNNVGADHEAPPKQKRRIKKEYSADGRSSKVKSSGEVCKGKRRICSQARCIKYAVQGGVCREHGAPVKLCSSEGCTNQAKNRGVCKKHGAKIKLCSGDGCTNQVQRGGVCIRHGAKVKLCSVQGCTNQAKKRRSIHQAWSEARTMQRSRMHKLC